MEMWNCKGVDIKSFCEKASYKKMSKEPFVLCRIYGLKTNLEGDWGWFRIYI